MVGYLIDLSESGQIRVCPYALDGIRLSTSYLLEASNQWPTSWDAAYVMLTSFKKIDSYICSSTKIWIDYLSGLDIKIRSKLISYNNITYYGEFIV